MADNVYWTYGRGCIRERWRALAKRWELLQKGELEKAEREPSLIRFSLTLSVYLWNVEIAISRVIAAGASNPILCNDLARCTYLLQICDHKWRNKHKNTKQFFQFCEWSSLNLRLLSRDRNLNIKWLNISLGPFPLFWRSIVKLYLQWNAFTKGFGLHD